ncbi:hypothetical protein BD410DRAFT_720943 [Rickenella mellea]|uniref:histidine kinase n=1 Tax=Rickenella mellea TaxID=50990 RepID=A0A4Y7Q7Q8_9AGAM|nr:hypothetical protein BD410DRAFT_720943 [Rickenella mellea]
MVSTKTALTKSILPAPVVATSSSSSSRKRRQKKSTRIEGGLKIHWAKFKKRITSPSESPSESGLDMALEGTDFGSQPRRAENPLDTERKGEELDLELEQDVDEVVVDRVWQSPDYEKTSVTHSEAGANAEKSGSHQPGTTLDHESLLCKSDHEGLRRYCSPVSLIRGRVWPAAIDFFSSRFYDEQAEAHYAKEIWFTSKPLAMWSSLFFVLNWVLGCALIPRPFVLADKIFYFGIAPLLTVPLPFMVMFDLPRDRPIFYQFFLCASTWCWGFYQIIFMTLCGYYSHKGIFTCGTKDFLSLFYYSTAMQTIAIFGLKLKRFPAMIAAILAFVVMSVLFIPYRLGWVRAALNFACFQVFLLYCHYMRELSERRLYTLRDQLKVQFRATQKAQINERKAADSKRRLTSYVFHEVRVPLNTALIAVQNMDASGTVAKDQEVEFKALEGSLSMMSKVLNDVLDFNRMDSGRFESVAKPYPFHQVMRSMFVPLRLATDARGLELVTELDTKIDRVARCAAYEAQGESRESVERLLEHFPDDDGIVVGDEMRLRQIITNLASNACKFTPTGGKLMITTKLIVPSDRTATSTPPSPSHHSQIHDVESLSEKGLPYLSVATLSRHNLHHTPENKLDNIVVRIEITDTGYGIRQKDLVRGKLFSAFNQTEQGRQQGGKGTGLGLALVRQIVKLSGGRLGVQSRIGSGSTFWVELPFGVGKVALCRSVNSSKTHSESNEPRCKPPSPGIPQRPSTPTHLTNLSRNSETGTRESFADDRPPTARNSLSAQAQGACPSSALKSIMEQGGLVELARGRSEGDPVPTRSIGDPSTGTESQIDVINTPTPTNEEPFPLSPSRLLDTQEGRTKKRPSYVELPKPPHFSPTHSPTISGAALSGELSSNASVLAREDPSDSPVRVLVVDDDSLTRKLMKRMLVRLGCRVSTAENGAVALELIMTGTATPSSEYQLNGLAPEPTPPLPRPEEGPRYEVVFLDNQMPVLSGLDTVAKLRQAGKTDFVVGVTGNALLADQQEYLDAGVDYVITKPVFERNLKSMLAIALDRRKNGASYNPQPPIPPPQ